jgi:hypothetical protein
MPRKPIHLELQGGKSPRQRLWEHIRATKGRDFEQLDVTPAGITNDSVCDYLQGLTNAGFLKITRQSKPDRTRQRWKLVKDPGVEAPRVRKNGEVVTQGCGNEAIWGAMQALGSFTPRVLAEMSDQKESTVKAYCLALKNAGYLTVERESKTGGRKGIQAQYRLLNSKVHGPRPPMITRLKAVYDPNIHAIVWQQGADEALEATE